LQFNEIKKSTYFKKFNIFKAHLKELILEFETKFFRQVFKAVFFQVFSEQVDPDAGFFNYIRKFRVLLLEY
jgi:hypothetical protein